MGQGKQQRTDCGSGADLATRHVEGPSHQRVEPPPREESVVSQPADQDEQLGLDQGQLPVQV